MRLIIIFCFVALYHPSISQMCQTVYQDIGNNKQYIRMIDNFVDSKTYDGDTPIVRLSLNQVNQTNGTGGLSWVAINNLLSGLSALYDNRICFTVIERNEIDNTNLFGAGNGGNLYEQLIMTNAVNDAIRIYFVENGNEGGIATSPIITPPN